MPTITFDQSGLPAGVAGRSRSDIVAATAVTITAGGVVGTAVFGLLGRPTASAAVLSGVGLTRSITPDVAGKYRVRIIDDNDGSSTTHTFTVRTANRGLAPLAWNERANPLANDVDVDPGTWVEESETNEGGLANGYHPDLEALVNAVDAIPKTMAIMVAGASGIFSTTVTRYLWPGFAEATAPNSQVRQAVPAAGVLRNLYVHANDPGGNGNDVVYTVRVNGVASSLAVTLASTGSTGSDVANSVAVAKGDLVDIEVTKAAAIGSSPNDVVATWELAES
jgi:hypothetical protein